MIADLRRYLSSGYSVEMIYMDRHGGITKRRIKLHGIYGDRIIAYCFWRRSMRSFLIGNILAAMPMEPAIGMADFF